MKLILPVFLFFSLAFAKAHCAERSTVIVGTLKNSPPQKVLLRTIINNRTFVVDSTLTDSLTGRFIFHLNISRQTVFTLQPTRKHIRFLTYSISPGDSLILTASCNDRFDINDISIEGSKCAMEKLWYTKNRLPLAEKKAQLEKKLANSKDNSKELADSIASIKRKLREIDLTYSHTTNEVNLLDYIGTIFREVSQDSCIIIVHNALKRIPDSKKLAELYNTLIEKQVDDVLRSKMLNKKMPTFRLEDTNGIRVKTSQFSGEYLLYDFWASWCIPCRNETLNIKEAVELSNGKLRVVAVSIDESRDKWLRAIQEDVTATYTHLIFPKDGWKSIKSALHIVGIPCIILVDPNGTIIDINLRGEHLTDRIRELFDTPATLNKKAAK